ncbi:MAG: GDP-L-fucose synthase [Bacteroidales bacterium]|nr:GDP-L-fucose synthase [Bacteroidales bacterium]
MEKNAKIYIAGMEGLVGSAIRRNLESKGYSNFISSPFPQYDLRNQAEVEKFFSENKPDYVFLAAAKVGGIVANNKYRAEFIYDNIMIQSNIIHQSYVFGVKKLLFLGSSCIYPKFAPQPMKEEHLLTDILEYTNEPYAISKIAGLKTVESYNLQYGTNFFAVMPTNLYGQNDNFDLEKSHVLPAMIRKMHLAKCLMNKDFEAIRNDLNKYPIEGIDGKADQNKILEIIAKYGITSSPEIQVELWGTGKPKREFLNSNDLADACVFLMENVDFKDVLKNEFGVENPKFPIIGHEIRNTHINIGVGEDQSIKELAMMIKEIVRYDGKIFWDAEKPDGTPRKLLDVSKLHSYGWKAKTPLKEGVTEMYRNYISK